MAGPLTHCQPTGVLPTGQISVPNFPGGAPINRPAGLVRGIVPILSGLVVGTVPILPPPLVDIGGIIPILYKTFSDDLQADGWVTCFPPTPGINYGPNQNAAIVNSLNNDATFGALYLATIKEWWDHLVLYVKATLGDWPIVPFGISLGGLTSVQIAVNRASTISAYGAHIAPVRLWTANPLVLGGTGFFGTADATTSVAAGSNNVALPISGGVLNVVSTTGFPSPSGTLVIVRGAVVGWQILQYTGTTPTTFTGCTGGNTQNGNLATGDVVQHSKFTSGCDIGMTGLNALPNGQHGAPPFGWIGFETSDSLIGYAPQQSLSNNAIAASQPVTQYVVNGGEHEFGSADVTAAVSWFTGTVDAACPKVF